MVSLCGRENGVIFKYIEINSSGHNSCKPVSFRELATKEISKKTRELSSARYICARDISSRNPSEGL